MKNKICPNCGKVIKGYPALSRKDNKTEICSNCGTLEALQIYKKYMEKEGQENGNRNKNS